MKKQLFWAAIAAVALTSCQEEKDIKDPVKAGANEVSFVLGATGTRAADEAAPVQEGVSLALGKLGDQTLYLEETVMDLNAVMGETRGTPIYTENLGRLFRDQIAVRTTGYAQDAIYQQQDDQTYANTNAWRYSYDYPVNIWADENADVQFHFRMPSDMGGHGVSNLVYTDGKTAFDYSSPEKAVDQEDIVFSFKKLNYKQYRAAYDQNGGVRVTLYHALSGVKFAIANDLADRTKYGMQVTGISFIGLKDTGKCEVVTAADGTTTVSWPTTSSAGIEIAQPIVTSDMTDYKKSDNQGHFADSYFDGGVNQNLNDAKATKTFWLVPQAFAGSEAILRISYTMSGKDGYMDINLGEAMPTTTWGAGQLRTYVLRLDEVNVKIEDKITMADATQQEIDTPWGPATATSYEGSEKNSVTITNTGNTDAYIRAALVGQWRTAAGDPVFGYTDFTHGVQLVDSWYVDQFVAKTYHQGRFTNLPGPNWTLDETDGFYYYQEIVPAGQAIPATDFLFEKYVVGKCPAAAIAGDVQDIYFTLEIAVQAVSAKKLNGTNYTLSEAWARANDSE